MSVFYIKESETNRYNKTKRETKRLTTMDYKNGKIYQILNNINDEVYVGSTTQPLCKRLYTHKSNSKGRVECKAPLYELMREIGKDIFYIELIELYPCNNREELRAREGYYIRERGSLNKVIAGRTFKMYYQDNKCKFKQYYEDNKEHIQEYHKQYYKQYYETNKQHYKQYYERNKDNILVSQSQYREQNITCNICGGQICRAALKRHQKTKKCKSFVKPIENEE